METFLQANLDELRDVLAGVRPAQSAAFLDLLSHHERIFVFGRGRSGLVMSMFAMRLMQLGLETHAIGEATAPAVQPGDLLVVGSGSGATESGVLAASQARALGAAVAVLCAYAESPISKLSDILVVLPGQTKDRVTEKGRGRMLAGTTFEQSLLIFCDCACALLAEARAIAPEDIMWRHANIE